MARGNFFGYEAYMICDGSLRNVARDGEVIGFQLDLRIANYRGYLLSQIEDLRVEIDGRWVEREAIRFSIRGNDYTLAEMEDTIDDRWGILDRATVTCLTPGGLAAGQHLITVEEHIRASYIPMTAVAFATKTLHVE